MITAAEALASLATETDDSLRSSRPQLPFRIMPVVPHCSRDPSSQQNESIAPLDSRPPARVGTDAQRSVSRDQRTNRTVLTLKKCDAIERAGQRIIESAISVTV